MKIERLKRQEHEKTRSLYQEVFEEDTKEFVDYYYQNKAAENEIFAAKEKEVICGMAHLNPYQLVIDGREEHGAYLVAVATKKEFRHRKVMTSLLKQIFQFLYEKKYMFLYLMPAAEAIYTPFDFRFFYSQREQILERKRIKRSDRTDLKVTEVKEHDFGILCDTLNEILEKKYRLFTKRTPKYLEDLKQELKAMKGRMMAVFDGTKCIGSFQIILEEEPIIFEPLFRENYTEQIDEILADSMEKELGKETEQVKIVAFSENIEGEKEKKKPWMMGRIIHLERWIATLKSKNKKEILIEIKDSWIPKNEGCYEIMIESDGGRLRRIEKKENLSSVSIADLPQLFKEESPFSEAFLNEWV